MIVFHMIAAMLSDKKFNPIVTELFISSREVHISLASIARSYFAVPKNIRLNSTHHFIIKIPKKDSLNKSHLIIHYQILTFKTL